MRGVPILPHRVWPPTRNLLRSPLSMFLTIVAYAIATRLQAFPPTNEISHGNGDVRFEAGDDHSDNDSSENGQDSPGWCRRRPGEHSARPLSPSRREGGCPIVPLPSAARPWTACPQSCKDRRKVAPARPHSAAGVMGSQSGGGVQLAGAGKTWSREISERTAPPRPTSALGGGKPHPAQGGGKLFAT